MCAERRRDDDGTACERPRGRALTVNEPRPHRVQDGLGQEQQATPRAHGRGAARSSRARTPVRFGRPRETPRSRHRRPRPGRPGARTGGRRRRRRRFRAPRRARRRRPAPRLLMNRSPVTASAQQTPESAARTFPATGSGAVALLASRPTKNSASPPAKAAMNGTSRPPDRLFEDRRAQEHEIDRCRRLEEDRARGRRQLVREHEQDHRRGVPRGDRGGQTAEPAAC